MTTLKPGIYFRERTSTGRHITFEECLNSHMYLLVDNLIIVNLYNQYIYVSWIHLDKNKIMAFNIDEDVVRKERWIYIASNFAELFSIFLKDK